MNGMISASNSHPPPPLTKIPTPSNSVSSFSFLFSFSLPSLLSFFPYPKINQHPLPPAGGDVILGFWEEEGKGWEGKGREVKGKRSEEVGTVPTQLMMDFYNISIPSLLLLWVWVWVFPRFLPLFSFLFWMENKTKRNGTRVTQQGSHSLNKDSWRKKVETVETEEKVR